MFAAIFSKMIVNLFRVQRKIDVADKRLSQKLLILPVSLLSILLLGILGIVSSPLNWVIAIPVGTGFIFYLARIEKLLDPGDIKIPEPPYSEK